MLLCHLFQKNLPAALLSAMLLSVRSILVALGTAQEIGMKKTQQLTKAFSALTLAIATSSAIAAGPGGFIGINGIYGSYDAEDITTGGTTSTPDKTTYGGGITVGANMSKNAAIEWGIEGLNKIEYNGDGSTPSQEIWFSFADFKPMVQSEYLIGFARIGVAYVDISQNNVDEDSSDHSKVRPMLGLGFGINVSPSSEVALSYNRIQDNDEPLDFAMLEYTYHFITHYTPGGFLED